MEEDMRVSGKMANNMATASLQILKVIPELVYGLMERGQGGLMSKKLLIFEKVILFKAFNNVNKDIFYEIALCFLSYIL